MTTKLHKKIGSASYRDLKEGSRAAVQIAWMKRRKFNELAARNPPCFKKEMFKEDSTGYIGVNL